MVKINKIYTKTGDQGDTHLVGGGRVVKNSAQVDAYGEVDELNSFLGLVRTLAESAQRPLIATRLQVIQNRLFDLGAELATPADKLTKVSVTEEDTNLLEQWIDEFIEGLPELRSFVIPGGTELNANLHIARAVCRRVERKLVGLRNALPLRAPLLPYVNRLSDLLFAMARYESHRSGQEEFLWTPKSQELP